jgi:hypothetical protein
MIRHGEFIGITAVRLTRHTPDMPPLTEALRCADYPLRGRQARPLTADQSAPGGADGAAWDGARRMERCANRWQVGQSNVKSRSVV